MTKRQFKKREMRFLPNMGVTEKPNDSRII